MYKEYFADSFGFTDDEIFIILEYENKEVRLDNVNNGMMSTGADLYNPWSINSFINDGIPHWYKNYKVG